MKTRINEGCQRRMSKGQLWGLTKHMGIGEYSEYANKRCATSVLRVQYDMGDDTRRDETKWPLRHAVGI